MQRWLNITLPKIRTWTTRLGGRSTRSSSGQSTTETMMMTLSAAVVIVTAIQGAIVLCRGMAVRQLAYQGARYAAANPGYDNATVINFVTQSVPSALSRGQLSVTMNPDSTPRSQGSAVSITVSFTGPTVALPTIITFPATVSATDTAMTE
jgi:hypothetical protein